jgi:uncharacterized protein YdiU (UPF0061 family)
MKQSGKTPYSEKGDGVFVLGLKIDRDGKN